MQRRSKAAFTLVELLIVLLLMGIVYALAFNYLMPKNEQEAVSDFTLETIDKIFKKSPYYRKSSLTLYCRENGKCLLAVGEKIVRSDIELRTGGVAYILNPDETLRSIEYSHIKIGTEEFRPSLKIVCEDNGLFDPQIIRSGETWYYIHPFGKPKRFDDPAAMVSFIRQSDYLPDQAGYAR